MLVFPISDTEPNGCRFEPLENGTVCLRFWREGKALNTYTVVSEPKNDAYVLLESFVSGGSFAEYLRESMIRFQGKVCLYLRPQAYRFPLPCPDGRGEPIELSERGREGFRYSETLCCLWRIADGGYAELADSSRSLREKMRIAEACGVPLMIADEETLAAAVSEHT